MFLWLTGALCPCCGILLDKDKSVYDEKKATVRAQLDRASTNVKVYRTSTSSDLLHAIMQVIFFGVLPASSGDRQRVYILDRFMRDIVMKYRVEM